VCIDIVFSDFQRRRLLVARSSKKYIKKK